MSQARCAPTSVDATADYSELGYSAKPFLERLGFLPGRRNPEPALSPADLRVHALPLARPLPPARLQEAQLGENPPDRGKTLDWPFPDLEREEQEFPA